MITHQELATILKTEYTLNDRGIVHNRTKKQYTPDRDGCIDGILADIPLRISFIKKLIG